MADNNFSKWLGGPNFVYAPQWASGRSNDGAARRRLNLTKRGRFNPNPTASGHPGCRIAAQSKADAEAYRARKAENV